MQSYTTSSVKPSYELRSSLSFYDVLRWRYHIKAACVDTKEIRVLRRVMLEIPEIVAASNKPQPKGYHILR